MLKKEKCYTYYSFELEEGFDVIKLDRVDSALRMANMKSVMCELEDIDGVASIEFNGHFGDYVYLRIDFKYDNKKTECKINTVIENAKLRYREDIEGHKYLVFLSTLKCNNKEEAANFFAESVRSKLDWIEDNEFSIKPERSNNTFEYFIQDNKDGTFNIYSDN